MGKYLNYGFGFSDNKDGFKAANEAAKKAVLGLKNKKPIISYVFFTGEYNPYQVSDGLKAVFEDTEFIGGSVDSVILNTDFFLQGILVVSLYSEYLHVGITSAENASKDPEAIAEKVITEALGKVKIDKYIDPYLAFTRMKNTKISWMLKLPSFYVTLFTRGIKLPVMGDETKIIQGISNVIGLQVPIWGGSFGNDAMKVLQGKPYDIHMLHSGKVLKDGLIIVVNSSSLLYSYALESGCVPTEKCGFVSEVDNGGFVVTKISNQDVVDWYAAQLGISRKEFLENTRVITQLNPLGVPDKLENYSLRGGGIFTGKGLAYVAPLRKGWPVYLMKGKEADLLTAQSKIKEQIENYVHDSKPALTFVTDCVTRRVVMQKNLVKELKALQKSLGNTTLVGFTCFGETGARPGQQCSFEHVSLNVFGIYDKLMKDLK